MSKPPAQLQARLEDYYRQISGVILRRQNPITGLLPASTAINAHGDYTDALRGQRLQHTRHLGVSPS